MRKRPERSLHVLPLLLSLTGCGQVMSNEPIPASTTGGSGGNATSSSIGGSTATPEPGEAGGVASTAAAPTSPDGGAVGEPKPRDPSVTCYDVVARNSVANDKFMVPQAWDLYHCYNYTPPWGSKEVQMVSFRPLIDNAKLVHHLLLYASDASVEDGSHADCIGAHPNSSLTAIWAPGGRAYETPADVGLEIAAGGLILEAFYENAEDSAQPDGSGFEVCVTDQKRPHTAALHWLGTENLGQLEATGTCRPESAGDVTILHSTPHMHLRGRHLQTIINRASGESEVLLDEAFDFNAQRGYDTPAVVRAGDTLTTTCTFAAPTPFGEGANDEMCYNFVVAYPAGGLARNIQVLRKYDCLGVF